ncbi:hypothetical protein [Sporocytophaga myxococcoides]|uniref:hypothetical protein n=1 Tax=Sporocytophaga myxococcoides TaxID=153721 RepID=UPI000490DDA6|nr:hypothetical protein [Sporocytophaga myxococcoides]
MENRNIILYVLCAAVALICIQGFFLLKQSSNLRESREILTHVLNEVRASRDIIEAQRVTIEDLKKESKALVLKVNEVDSMNTVIKKNLDANFNNANKTINEIRRTVDGIRSIQIH